MRSDCIGINSNIGLLFALTLYFFCTPAFGDNSNPAAKATPRTQEFDWMSLDTWREKHGLLVREANTRDIDLLFLGDSITEGWTWGENPSIFTASFGRYRSANFGIGGDQTQNVLWRLRNGETGSMYPRLIVLMIGTNNFGHSHHTAEAVSGGVRAIIVELQKHWPETRILLLGILPFGEKASDPSRLQVEKVNRLLARLDDQEHVFFRDFGALFLDSQGDIPEALMADFLHPTHAGYEKLAEQLKPVVDSLMSEMITANDS